MHILIIPSEEFVPATNHTSAIFQYHQAVILKRAGYQVGALSVRQEYSIPMILRAALWRAFHLPVGNSLDERSIGEVGRLLRDKVMRPGNFVRHEVVGTIPTVRIDGFYYIRPSPRTNHIGWIEAGVQGFNAYCESHGKPDVIHAHNLDSAGMLANRIQRRHGIPYVVTEHSTYFERGLVPRGLYARLARAARESSSFSAVSPGLSRVVQRHLGLSETQIEWLPNVLDPVFVDLPLVDPPRTQEGFGFLCLGNLIPVKNHSLLLRAFHEAFAQDAAISLRIGGDGPLRGELEELATRLGIQDRIAFLGRLSRSDVMDELDRCNAFVLPSLYETFGVVLIEALARGRPVITTLSGGPESFITPADGIMVPIGNQAALASAMRQMVEHADEFDSKDLRRRVIEQFGPDALLSRLEPIYMRATS